MRPDHPSDQDEPVDETGGAKQPPGPELPIFGSARADAVHGEDDPDDPEIDDETDDEGDDDDVDEDDEDDDDEIQDELLPGMIEGEPRTVLITGACGNLGRKLRAAWADVYDLVLIDKAAALDDPDVIVADLSVLDDDWITHFHGVDTVVHLAANGNEFAPWDELIGPNLDALANVFHAAALAGAERVLFARSNHDMGEYQHLGDGPITIDMPPMPDGPYAVTKLVGERLGRSSGAGIRPHLYRDPTGLDPGGENRPDTLPHEWARLMWLSNADLISLFDWHGRSRD